MLVIDIDGGPRPEDVEVMVELARHEISSPSVFM